MSRVAVAMSGGVDSSVAAAMLRAAGEDVVGITLQLWDYSGVNLASGRGRCCSPSDVADARAVAAALEIPHFVFDHSSEFRQQVVEPFLQVYAGGRTPSPCITCNRRVKFDLLWKLARSLGCETLATGHYARLDVDESSGRPLLRRAVDVSKDQSYFLYDVAAEALAGVRFPLGALSKQEVREVAAAHGLAVADKPESYDLCFIPDGDKNAFVERQGSGPASAPGAIVHLDGEVLGAHSGTHRFTIGQRRGLGLQATTDNSRSLYVVEIAADTTDGTRTVTVGPESALMSDGLIAARCNWLAIAPPTGELLAAARIRHRHSEVMSRISPVTTAAPVAASSAWSTRFRVDFDRPQRAIAPGQGIAFYYDDLLLGGGWIESAAPTPTAVKAEKTEYAPSATGAGSRSAPDVTGA